MTRTKSQIGALVDDELLHIAHQLSYQKGIDYSRFIENAIATFLHEKYNITGIDEFLN